MGTVRSAADAGPEMMLAIVDVISGYESVLTMAEIVGTIEMLKSVAMERARG